MDNRPYMHLAQAELADLYAHPTSNDEVRRQIAIEFRHRFALKAAVAGALDKLEPADTPHEAPTTAHGAHGMATDRVFDCPGCEARLRVKLLPGTNDMRCPRCHAHFSCTFHDGVLSIAPAGAAEHMSLDEAYECMGLPANATLETIKHTRLRLLAQYHPDKVAALGSKLQKVAGDEALRINAAYRLIIAAHAGSST